MSKTGSNPRMELFLYARSFHTAAKSLAASFQPPHSLLPDCDASPVVFITVMPLNSI